MSGSIWLLRELVLIVAGSWSSPWRHQCWQHHSCSLDAGQRLSLPHSHPSASPKEGTNKKPFPPSKESLSQPALLSHKGPGWGHSPAALTRQYFREKPRGFRAWLWLLFLVSENSGSANQTHILLSYRLSKTPRHTHLSLNTQCWLTGLPVPWDV